MWTSKERPASYGVDEERSWEWHCVKDPCDVFSVVLLQHTKWDNTPPVANVSAIARAEAEGIVVDDAVKADPALYAAFATAYLRAQDVADAKALLERTKVDLGNVVRDNWDLITRARKVSEFARTLDVERTSLYQVQDGKLWA
jgi:hypothetical protein